MLGVSIGKSNYRATTCFPNVDAERVVLRCPAQGFPRKFWKKIKIKQAIDRARRERLRGCHPGDFAFTFANDPRNEGNTGIVTGCISGLHCPQVGGPASSVRVVTNEDGFGIGEYFQGNDTQQIFNNFTVDAHCDFELFSR